MDKKNLVVIFSLSLILILSLSFVSAGLFSNLWGKITGKYISPPAVAECLTANTQIHMVDGSYKPVEDIAVGDVVLGKNGSNTVVSLYNLILGKQNLYSFNGGRVFVTKAHPFMTTEGWKAIDPVYAKRWNPNLKIGQLSVGDKLITENSQVLLESIEAHEAPYFTKIYNFAVDGDKTYYADGYLVHNKAGNCPTICPSNFECGKYLPPPDSDCPPLTCGFCSSGEICQNGACIASSITCSETDNGYNLSKNGTCIDSSGTYLDACTAENALREYYCHNNACTPVISGCLSDQTCQNSACVSSTPPATTCSDNDTGNKPNIYGKCTDVDGKDYLDSCDDNGNLIQYGCNKNGGCSKLASSCAFGEVCKDGACVSSTPSTPTCSDTDGGVNISKAGTATDSLGTKYFDSCCTHTAVNEISCFDPYKSKVRPKGWVSSFQIAGSSVVFSSIINCPQGEVCDKDACVLKTSTTCTDPDKTNVVGPVESSYRRTRVKQANGDYSPMDYCQKSKEYEYSCNASDGTYEVNIVPCAYGCAGQECKRPTQPPVCEYENNLMDSMFGRNSKYTFTQQVSQEKFEAGPLREIKAQCKVNFKSRILNNLPTDYVFNISGMRIIKILNISADKETSALLNFTLNKSEIKYSPDIIKFYTWDKSHSKWTNLTRGDPVSAQDEYNFNVKAPHFSLFVIAEPELCGNGVFDSAYEQCDNTSNCNSSCMCEKGFASDREGNCTTSIVSTACSPINATNCSGRNYVKCNESSLWEDQGVVVGDCGADCLPGDTSCDNYSSLFCGTDYKWALEGKIVGKCNYTSEVANLDYSSPNGNDNNYYSNSSNESGNNRQGTNPDNLKRRNLIIFIIAVSLLAILVLFLLFKKLKNDDKRYSHRPGTPVRRTVSRTPPSSQGFRTATPSRRPVRRTYYPR